MNIDLLQNDEFVFGAALTEFSEGHYCFYRMTPELQDFYSYSEAADVRAHCPSGVRIGFISDTGFLAMQVRFGRNSRPIYSIDVVVDGMQKMTFSPEEFSEIFSFSTEISGDGEKRIEIFLPVMCECDIMGIEIEDGSFLQPIPSADERMIFIGDSITQGMVVSTPSLAYPAQVAAAMECDFHNIAVGGAIMQDEVARLALDLDWDKAFVAFGINDFAQNRILDDFEKATAKTLEALVSREDAEVFIITPIPWADRTDPNEIGIYVENYREIIRKVADGMDRVTIIEGSKLVPDEPEMYVDNIHPNDKGMSLYAENLVKELKK